MRTTIQQIGKRLCARRNQMDLTQEQLAESQCHRTDDFICGIREKSNAGRYYHRRL